MRFYPPKLEELLAELSKLPGIGPKSSERIAFYLLKSKTDQIKKLARAIIEAKEKIKFCRVCFNFTEEEVCEICKNPLRDQSIICVVEEARDLMAIEKSDVFKGLYHVLQGSISPLEGKGPEELRIDELFLRLKEGKIKEVVLATNPNLEGETTAMYLAEKIKPMGIKVTKLASGLPMGGDLEYADEVTLGRAIEGRREM